MFRLFQSDTTGQVHFNVWKLIFHTQSKFCLFVSFFPCFCLTSFSPPFSPPMFSLLHPFALVLQIFGNLPKVSSNSTPISGFLLLHHRLPHLEFTSFALFLLLSRFIVFNLPLRENVLQNSCDGTPENSSSMRNIGETGNSMHKFNQSFLNSSFHKYPTFRPKFTLEVFFLPNDQNFFNYVNQMLLNIEIA